MMNFFVDSQTYGPIRFRSGVPASLAKWTMRGSQPFSAEGTFGSILMQLIHAGTAQLIYTTCNIRKDLALDFSSSGPVWLTHIALKNENRFDIAGTGPVYLKQGQFNMIQSYTLSGTLYLEKGNEYQAISIYYSREQLEEVLPFFPFLNNFIRESDSGKPLLLFTRHHWIDSQLIDIIGHFLHCTFRGSLRQLYFDYKIKELLWLLLDRENATATTPKDLDDRTIELISEAKYIIEAALGQAVTLDRIARKLGMTKAKLESGFRMLFGSAPGDHRLPARNEKVKLS